MLASQKGYFSTAMEELFGVVPLHKVGMNLNLGCRGPLEDITSRELVKQRMLLYFNSYLTEGGKQSRLRSSERLRAMQLMAQSLSSAQREEGAACRALLTACDAGAASYVSVLVECHIGAVPQGAQGAQTEEDMFSSCAEK